MYKQYHDEQPTPALPLPFWSRVVAQVIDLALVAPVIVGVWLLSIMLGFEYEVVVNTNLPPLGHAGAQPQIAVPEFWFLHNGWFAIDITISIVLPTLYFFVSEAVFCTTAGRFLTGLRVSTVGGGRPSIAQTLVRNAWRPVDSLFLGMLGLGLAIRSPIRQRLGDRMAATVVTRREPLSMGLLNHERHTGQLPPGTTRIQA